MRGISDLDSLCLREIFKNLTPLDLCSVRHCSKGLRYFVEDHFHSLHFVGEQLLDLTAESNLNVSKILKHFGKSCRRLKIHQKSTEPNLMLDVIATNCGKILKELSLNSLHLYEMDMVKFEGVFDNLEILELIDCRGNQQCINFEYPNLTTLRIISSLGHFCLIRSIRIKILEKFFMKKRSIKALTSRGVNNDLLPLIALNAIEIEELDIFINYRTRNLTTLAQLRNLKVLDIHLDRRDLESIIPLIKELSVNTELEIFGMTGYFHFYTNEFWDALSNLTSLKQLRFNSSRIRIFDSEPIEMLSQKLTKLESLVLMNNFRLPYQNFFELVCKSNKLRTVYVRDNYKENDIEQMIKNFIDEGRHRCFVSGNPLCIYLENETFNTMNVLLTQDNLKSIEKNGNIKIYRAKNEDFPMFAPNFVHTF